MESCSDVPHLKFCIREQHYNWPRKKSRGCCSSVRFPKGLFSKQPELKPMLPPQGFMAQHSSAQLMHREKVLILFGSAQLLNYKFHALDSFYVRCIQTYLFSYTTYVGLYWEHICLHSIGNWSRSKRQQSSKKVLARCCSAVTWSMGRKDKHSFYVCSLLDTSELPHSFGSPPCAITKLFCQKLPVTNSHQSWTVFPYCVSLWYAAPCTLAHLPLLWQIMINLHYLILCPLCMFITELWGQNTKLFSSISFQGGQYGSRKQLISHRTNMIFLLLRLLFS